MRSVEVRVRPRTDADPHLRIAPIAGWIRIQQGLLIAAGLSGTDTLESSMSQDQGQHASAWRAEAVSMRDAGLELQRLAVSLPVESKTREQLLTAAKRWFLKARLRGLMD